ncbi:LysR family transcriptional regulator [Variovorax sp.]|jgi:DNA-binding transcriptional LysR family regulator|uniref:LysR family transcriptional regulator n=1 Tax=Variovorax TaxID=34072 RepID=UPI0009EAD142|nr:LysR family transcriptional regulator [Variovorax sp.]MBN8748727.1 LysR family transcriptional regulator [Variovorax sp.]MBS77000.1 LysR family transcriptional regulator [Variovorax sp.]
MNSGESDPPPKERGSSTRSKRSALGERVAQHLIDSRRLFYFSQVAKMGSFTAAEAALDLAQSTLSRQIQLLEEELGAPLLLRESRGVTLTHAGELLLAQAERIIREMESAREQITMARGGVRGRVTIAAPRPFSSRYFPKVIQQFSQKYPNTKLTVLEASSGHVHQYLADAAVDLAVVLHNPNSQKIATRKIVTEHLYLTMRHDHALAGEALIERGRLQAISDLLLPAAVHGTRFVIERYLQDGNIEIEPMIRMDSVSLMRTMISQGLGCAILPNMACTRQLDSGEFVAKPLKPALSRTLYLARLRERNQTPEAKAMEDEIVRAVETDTGAEWETQDD